MSGNVMSVGGVYTLGMLLTTDTLVFVAEDLDETESAPGLVQAREARDRARFEEDALSHADQLYRIALRLTGSPTAAEDLVQEAYLRAFRSWRSFTPGTNLAAWLATILRNVNLDAVRKQNRRPRQESIDEQGDYYLYNRLSAAPPQPQEEVLDRLGGAGAIVDSMADLPPAYREVVVLVDIGEFSYADAAGILGVPIGTVMSRLYRGRRLLKQALADRAPAQEPTP
jgi:RNA polymerase sigma-70 factor (ECF subfamily)